MSVNIEYFRPAMHTQSFIEHIRRNADELNVRGWDVDRWALEKIQEGIRDGSMFKIALFGNKVCGFVILAGGKNFSDARTGRLRLCVDLSHRRVGIGSRLLRAALLWADSRSLARVEATPYDEEKVGFFRSFGFRWEGNMRNAAQLVGGDLTDVTLLARYLT